MIGRVDTPPGSNQDDLGAKFKESFVKWRHETPAMTRSTVFVALAGTVLGLFGLNEFLGENSALNTVLRVQIWRPFTAGFIGNSIISDVFAIFAIYQVCNVLEPKKGSTFLLSTALASTVFIQFTTVVVLTLVGLALSPMFLFVSGGGYWPLAFVLLGLESKNSTDQSRQLMCLPFEVPTRYYPAILAALFFLLSGFRSLDIFVGLGLGYLLGTFTQLQFSTEFSRLIESKASMKFVTDLPGYITIDSIGFPLQFGETMQERRRIGSVSNGPANSKQSRFKPFSGVGHKLGTAVSSDLSIDGEAYPFRVHPLAERYSFLNAIEVPIDDNSNLNSENNDEKSMEDYLI